MRDDSRDIVHALIGAVVLLGMAVATGCRHDRPHEPDPPAEPAQAEPAALADCACDQGEAPLVFRVHARKAALIWFLPDRRDEWCGLVGVAGVESHWRNDAVSEAGAFTAYQVLRGTWAEHIAQMGLEGSPFDPWISSQVAARHLARSDAFWVTPRSEMCDWGVEIASYNAGEGNVLKGQVLAGGALCWSEIKGYMHRVTGHHATETINHVARWHRITSRQCGYELPAGEL